MGAEAVHALNTKRIARGGISKRLATQQSVNGAVKQICDVMRRSNAASALQYVIDSLKPGGRCGIVLDEGVLFRTNETAFVQTKRKLLDDCDLWCILSLPGDVFSAAGAGVKTNLLFFTKGEPTERVRYYDLSDIKVGKKTPFTLDRFEEFFRLLPDRADSDRSWTVTREEIETKGYDLKAVNPNAKTNEDTRTLRNCSTSSRLKDARSRKRWRCSGGSLPARELVLCVCHGHEGSTSGSRIRDTQASLRSCVTRISSR